MQHWETLAPSGPFIPKKRSDHAATYFTQSNLGMQGNLLLVVGGFRYDDSWICDLTTVEWKRVSVHTCAINGLAMIHVVMYNRRSWD